MSVEGRLKELGIEIPEPTPPRFSYLPVNQTGNLVFTSGQLCLKEGKLIYTGKLGQDLTIEQGQEAARQCIINCLAVLRAHLGSLDRIKKVVKILGFVNSSPGFTSQPLVINGASDLLIDVFGENGRHARSAVGTSELPSNTPVEIEIIVEVE